MKKKEGERLRNVAINEATVEKLNAIIAHYRKDGGFGISRRYIVAQLISREFNKINK